MASAAGAGDAQGSDPAVVQPLALVEEEVGDDEFEDTREELEPEVPTKPDEVPAQVPPPAPTDPLALPPPLRDPGRELVEGGLAQGGVRPKAYITQRQKQATVSELSQLLGQMSINSPSGGLKDSGELSLLYQQVRDLTTQHHLTAAAYETAREEGERAKRERDELRDQVAAYTEELDALRGAEQSSASTPSVQRDPICDQILLRLSVHPLPASDWDNLNPRLAQYLHGVGTWPVSTAEGGLTPDPSGVGARRQTSGLYGQGAVRHVNPHESGASPELRPASVPLPAPGYGVLKGSGPPGHQRVRDTTFDRRVAFQEDSTPVSRFSAASPETRTMAPGQGQPSATQPACGPDVFASLEQRLGDLLSEVRALHERSEGRAMPTSTPAAGYGTRPRVSYGGVSYVPHQSPAASTVGYGRLGATSAAPAATVGGERTISLPPHTRIASGTVDGGVVVSPDVTGPMLIGVHIDDRSVYPVGEVDPLGYYIGQRLGSPITQGWGPALDPRMIAQLDQTYSVGAGYGFCRPEERYQGEPDTEFGGKDKERRFRQLGKLVRIDFPQMNNVDEAYLWTQWHAKFVGYARALRLTYEEMGYTLALYLSQCVKAAQAVATLPPVLASDYNTLVTLCANLFCPSGRAAAAQARLNARVQSGETAQQFAVNLLKLVESAYPCSRVAFTSERRQEAALRRFCEGLTDRTLALRIMDRRCTTVQQGLTLVDEYAVNMRTPGVAASVLALTGADFVESDSCSDVSDGQMTVPADVLAVTRKDTQVRSNGPAVPSDGKKSLSRNQKRKGPKKPAQGTPSSSGTASKTPKPNAQAAGKGAQSPRECWSCGKTGHLMRECRLKSGRKICFVSCDEHFECDLPEDF